MKTFIFLVVFTVTAMGSAASYEYEGPRQVREFLADVQEAKGYRSLWRAIVANPSECFRRLTTQAQGYGLTGYRITKITASYSVLPMEKTPVWQFEVSGAEGEEKGRDLYSVTCSATKDSLFSGGGQQ